MPNKISRIVRLATNIFASASAPKQVKSPTPEQLNRLISVLNSLTYNDVGLDLRLLLPFQHLQAPIVYVHILENELLSVGIFVLRPGSCIPLHDHPNMFGIAKVIYGSLRCRSYSRLNDPIKEPNSLIQNASYGGDTAAAHQPFVAEIASNNVYGVNDDACLVTPSRGNFHELSTLPGESGAAFLDILSPPYDHDTGLRRCRFYQVIGGAGGDEDTQLKAQVQMEEVTQPADYYCDTAVYKGAKVTFK